jgi:hypothetical protein
MLITALILLQAFFVSYYFGYLGFTRFQYVLVSKTESFKVHVSLYQLMGLALLAFICSVLHLCYPINASSFYLISFSALASGFMMQPRIFKEATRHLMEGIKANKFPYLISLIIAVLSICSRPGIGDIADYHLQALKWAEQYKNIIGLGNFNRPLANNNWWFNIQALFGNASHSIYVLNALMFILVFTFLVNNESKNNMLKIFGFVLAGFVAVSTKTAFVGSVTPDYAITNLIFICSYLFLSYHFSKEKIYLHLIILFALFAVTIKLNSVLLLGLALLSFIELIKDNHSKKYWIGYSVIASFTLGIWVLGNVMVSGWLCYPASGLDLFQFDWKMPKEVLDMERFSIKQWGKVPFQDIQITAQMSLAEWLPLWLEKLDFFNKGLLGLSVLTTLLFIIKYAFEKEKQKTILSLAIISLIGIAFCFSNGPHVRYAYGYIVVLLALGLAYLLSKKINLINKWMMITTLVISIVGVAPKIVSMKNEGILSSSIVYPKAYPIYNLDSMISNGNTLYITKQNSTCWTCFPCSYYMLKNCQLRGNTFEEGFRVNQP